MPGSAFGVAGRFIDEHIETKRGIGFTEDLLGEVKGELKCGVGLEVGDVVAGVHDLAGDAAEMAVVVAAEDFFAEDFVVIIAEGIEGVLIDELGQGEIALFAHELDLGIGQRGGRMCGHGQAPVGEFCFRDVRLARMRLANG